MNKALRFFTVLGLISGIFGAHALEEVHKIEKMTSSILPKTITFQQPTANVIMFGSVLNLINYDKTLQGCQIRFSLNVEDVYKTPDEVWTVASDSFSEHTAWLSKEDFEELKKMCKEIKLPDNYAFSSGWKMRIRSRSMVLRKSKSFMYDTIQRIDYKETSFDQKYDGYEDVLAMDKKDGAKKEEIDALESVVKTNAPKKAALQKTITAQLDVCSDYQSLKWWGKSFVGLAALAAAGFAYCLGTK